ncbi:MAG: penicillin acylase family protein, partial [Halobacteriovoraceae bacterium]|nr:penicillin acylase family protein [Halobacteriovoraceae bacterium]
IETQPLPIEFKILGYKPRPFSPQEAVAVSGYLALSFAEGILADPLHTDLLNQFPKELVEQMWIREKNDKNVVTQQRAVTVSLTDQPWYSDFIKTQNFLRDAMGLFHGSNSWVLSGKRSVSGYPILANDPHVAFSNPAVWYEAHLKSPEYEIYGHFIPLVPFPAMGHDRDRGWAVTMSEIDDMDLYEEKVNDLGQVQYKGKWVPLIVDKEIIKVKGGKDIEIDVKRTPHGPLLNGTKYEVPGKNIALKWSYHHPGNDVATAVYKLSHTKKLDDLDDALKHGATPGLNVSWVDREGNIAWRVMGKIPVRRGFLGNQILEGWSGKHEYERYFTIDEHPGMVNPEDGVIVTANYHPQYNGPLPLEGYWQPGERFERIYDLLKKKEKWTLAEMKAIQNDQFVVTGLKMKELLLSEVVPKNDKERDILKRFGDWNGESGKGSFGSSLYHMWTHHLGKTALYDELGETRFVAFNKVADFWNFFKTFLYDKENVLWDDVKTPQKETRKDLVNESFRLAVARLTERLGENYKNWKWGNV